MAIYTEAEARNKTAFTDCGSDIRSDITIGMPMTKCIASDCIGWVWDDGEKLRYAMPVGRLAGEWKEYSPGSAYTQDEVPQPDGEDIGWQKFMPYQGSDSRGWWTRPRSDRRGHCGRILLTAVLESP